MVRAALAAPNAASLPLPCTKSTFPASTCCILRNTKGFWNRTEPEPMIRLTPLATRTSRGSSWKMLSTIPSDAARNKAPSVALWAEIPVTLARQSGSCRSPNTVGEILRVLESELAWPRVDNFSNKALSKMVSENPAIQLCTNSVMQRMIWFYFSINKPVPVTNQTLNHLFFKANITSAIQPNIGKHIGNQSQHCINQPTKCR